jgi:hypothetical protein
LPQIDAIKSRMIPKSVQRFSGRIMRKRERMISKIMSSTPIEDVRRFSDGIMRQRELAHGPAERVML